VIAVEGRLPDAAMALLEPPIRLARRSKTVRAASNLRDSVPGDDLAARPAFAVRGVFRFPCRRAM